MNKAERVNFLNLILIFNRAIKNGKERNNVMEYLKRYKWEWYGWDYFNPFTPKDIVVYKNKYTKKVKHIKKGYCWPCLFFGYLWFFSKGMWLYFFAAFIFAWFFLLLTHGATYYIFLWIAYFGLSAHMARRDYGNHLIKKGYKKIDTIKPK